MSADTGISQRLEAIREKVAAACDRAGRSREDVTLLAVSKTFPSECILEAYRAGQIDFGESRQQEAAAKVAELPEEILWHFIGKLQRNKVRKVLGDFGCLHSIDSLKLAAHVDRVAGEEGCRPEVYFEVNLAEEENKGGFLLSDLNVQMESLLELGNLNVRGLMVIPPAEGGQDDARRWFVKAREFRDQLQSGFDLELPGLSMGMSGDFEVAIEEGSTIVRVGSAIFGHR